MDWVKPIAELLKAIAHFAWPLVTGLALWWFRKPIAKLMDRIWKLKAFGAEMETTKEEVNLALENTKAAIPEEIKKVEAAVQIAAKSTSTATVHFDLVEGLDKLMELARTDPRRAIRRSWELLAKAVFRATGMAPASLDPTSPDFNAALDRLKSSDRISESVIRAIRNLQDISRKVFLYSEFAYMPSNSEAEEFVLYSAAARTDLGEKVS